MRSKPQFSTKRLAIDKANQSMLIAVGVAAFIVVFCLVASRALLAQRSYQAKVISEKEKARDQLEKNLEESDRLIIAYKEFNGTSPNVLGGNPKGTADQDGENARIILDALPGSYDFPALATSINKLVTANGFQISSISGTDDEAAQASAQASSSPTPVEVPFSVSSKSIASTDGKKFLELFERSIRPFKINRLSIQGQSNVLNITVDGKTYYQSGKAVDVQSVPVPNGKAAPVNNQNGGQQ